MKYEKIGIIAAMDKELDGLVANMKNVSTETFSGRKYYIGTIGNKTVVASKSGIGKVFAAMCAQTMILEYAPDCIINIGIAGGLDERVKILDIVVATSVVQHDMNLLSFGAPGRGYIQFDDGNVVFMDCDKTLCEKISDAATSLGINNVAGIVASGDIFVAEKNVKDKIKNEFGASACEMEGGAIGQACFAAKMPFCVLRAISDGGDEAAEMDYPMFAEKAADRSIKVIMKFLENDN